MTAPNYEIREKAAYVLVLSSRISSLKQPTL